jgi:hypothetical protein
MIAEKVLEPPGTVHAIWKMQTIPMERRFTVDGDEALESELARLLAKVLAGVREVISSSHIEGIMLGGGYGRGEGGVLKTKEGERPYNDIEFYILMRGPALVNRRLHGPALRHFGEEISGEAGIEVEFKITSRAELRRAPVSMFYYDLIMGHRWLSGGEHLLAGCEHHAEAANIGLSEATRLLMNRCTGLLFAKERLHKTEFTQDDADFVARNIAKARLAFGDAVLTLFGQYHWSCIERDERLRQLKLEGGCFEQVLRDHAMGVEFKLHPSKSVANRKELEEEHERVGKTALEVWLWLESTRLKTGFDSAENYAFHPDNKCPQTKPWRNVLVNAAVFGPSCGFPMCFKHPRERILRALPLLLWDTNCLGDTRKREYLQRLLETTTDTYAQFVGAYRKLWSKVS